MIWTRQPDDRSEMRSTAEISSAPATAAAYARHAERRREHQQHRVRQRHRGAVLEAQHEQLAEHEAGREEHQRAVGTRRVGEVRDGRRRRAPAITTNGDPAAEAHCFAFFVGPLSASRSPRPGRAETDFGRVLEVRLFLVALAVHLVALLDRADERLGARGVELRARLVAQLLERDLLRQRLAVRTGRGHGVVGVGDHDDVRLDRVVGVVGVELHRVAVRVHRDRPQEVDVAEHLHRHALVDAHARELFLGELARLVQQLVRARRACRCRASTRAKRRRSMRAGMKSSSSPM